MFTVPKNELKKLKVISEDVKKTLKNIYNEGLLLQLLLSLKVILLLLHESYQKKKTNPLILQYEFDFWWIEEKTENEATSNHIDNEVEDIIDLDESESQVSWGMSKDKILKY